MHQGVVGRLERADAFHGIGHHSAQPGDTRIGIGAGLLDEMVEHDARLSGGILEDRELPADFVEVAAEALQVLLHELRALRKQNGAQHAQDAINETVEDAQETPAGWHTPSVKPPPLQRKPGCASQLSAMTEIMRASGSGLELIGAMRVVILGSGRGSNAEAILRAQAAGRLGAARVVQILSDKSDAGILDLGLRFGVPATFVDPAPFKTKLEGPGEERFIATIKAARADLVVLAGFMRVLKPGFLEAFVGNIINLHPSLLPAFPGLDSISQAFRTGVRVTGCTVHYVTQEVDAGRIIEQTQVPVEPGDTLETLTARVHAAEHQLLPAVIERLSQPAR